MKHAVRESNKLSIIFLMLKYTKNQVSRIFLKQFQSVFFAYHVIHNSRNIEQKPFRGKIRIMYLVSSQTNLIHKLAIS